MERLFSPLVVRHVLTSDELQTLQNESPVQRLDSLLDILTMKDYETFKRFCVVLETTYPYMLNCMFLGVEPPSLTGKNFQFLTCDLCKQPFILKDCHRLSVHAELSTVYFCVFECKSPAFGRL